MSDEIKAVIGIWSDYFLVRINGSAKFRINKNTIYVDKHDDLTLFYIHHKDGSNMRVYCTCENLIPTCRRLRKMMEAE
mgnify:CR=1 FL=1